MLFVFINTRPLTYFVINSMNFLLVFSVIYSILYLNSRLNCNSWIWKKLPQINFFQILEFHKIFDVNFKKIYSKFLHDHEWKYCIWYWYRKGHKELLKNLNYYWKSGRFVNQLITSLYGFLARFTGWFFFSFAFITVYSIDIISLKLYKIHLKAIYIYFWLWINWNFHPTKNKQKWLRI